MTICLNAAFPMQWDSMVHQQEEILKVFFTKPIIIFMNNILRVGNFYQGNYIKELQRK